MSSESWKDLSRGPKPTPRDAGEAPVWGARLEQASKILSEERQKTFRATDANPDAFLKYRFPGTNPELPTQNITTRAFGAGLNCGPKYDYEEALTPLPQNGRDLLWK